MATSEITEENDEDNPCTINYEAQKESLRRIIAYQKARYFSSSSSSSLSSSAASSSSRTTSSLMELMKGGSTSLKRLFDMEHTSLSTYFQDYSVFPIIETLPLWGSDTDGETGDPWEEIRKNSKKIGSTSQTEFASGGSFISAEFENQKTKKKMDNRKLTRKKSFRRLPGFNFRRLSKFRFRLRLRRFRIMICGRIS
ncbi:hypothetical protein SLA2020_118980 [Shorea laevis]